MDSFRWISVAMSMLLGLAVARLLSSGVAVFVSRRHSRLDWVPLAWAACIFIAQLQYWWAVIDLASIDQVWTIGKFLLLVGLPLLLFVAAALVLPHEGLQEKSDLREWFNRDGRWALLFVSAYYALAVVVDWVLWNDSPFTTWVALDVVLVVLPIAFLARPSRRVREAITLLFVVVTLWESWMLSPKSY